MKTLYLILFVLFISACEPEQTTTFKVDNQTQYSAKMVLYSNGAVSKTFQIEKSTSEVIFKDSGLSPDAFQVNEFDSVKFSFEDNKLLVFVNDTVNSPNDIYNGANWLVENKGHAQIFTYTINH